MEKELPKIAVIIPHYSLDKEYLHLCCESLMKQTYTNLEVIVSSSSIVTPTGLHPNIRLYQSKERMHYAQAINKGAQIAVENGAQYLILGNDDTIYTQTTVADLFASTEGYARIVNPLSNCDNGVLFHKRSPFFVANGDKVLELKPSMLREEVRGFEEAIMNFSPSGNTQIDFIPSHLGFTCYYCTMIPTEVWLKLGPLDEQFVTAGFEDADYSFRARQHRVQSGFTTRSFVFHFAGKTSSVVTTDEERKSNQEKFNKKWNIV